MRMGEGERGGNGEREGRRGGDEWSKVRRVHFLKSPLDEEKQSMVFYSNFT